MCRDLAGVGVGVKFSCVLYGLIEILLYSSPEPKAPRYAIVIVFCLSCAIRL